MILRTLHCPALGARVRVETCFDRHRDANALLAHPPRGLTGCIGCAVGRRNRLRFAREGMRVSLAEIDLDRAPTTV